MYVCMYVYTYIISLGYSVFQREMTMRNSVNYKFLLPNHFVSEMEFTFVRANCEAKVVNILRMTEI